MVTLKRLPYPGTPLTVGSSGSAVLYYSLLLQRIAYYFTSVENPPLSDQYTDETAAATRSAQELLGLPETGIADADTWTAVEALSLQLAAEMPNPDRSIGHGPVYPGPGPSALRSIWMNWISQRSYATGKPPEPGKSHAECGPAQGPSGRQDV